LAAASISSPDRRQEHRPRTCLLTEGGRRPDELGWAAGWEGEGKSWAGNGPKQGRFSFFFKIFFYFLFSQNPLRLYEKILQIQYCLRKLETIQSPS
jgi:hypothetical protein